LRSELNETEQRCHLTRIPVAQIRASLLETPTRSAGGLGDGAA